jgi:hypothetical protein
MKTETFVNMCVGKKRYTSSELADKIAKRIKKERNVDLRSYYCPICCWYHLTKAGKENVTG